MKPKLKFFVRTLSFVLLLVLLALPFILQRNVENRYCQSINIFIKDSTDYCIVSSEDILQQLSSQSNPILGYPIGTISLSEIEKNINNVYGVRRAEVYLDINGTLNISIDQRRPIMRVEPDEGGVFYVDSEGFLFDKRDNTPFLLYYVGGNVNVEEQLLQGISLLDTTLNANPLTDVFKFINRISEDKYWSEMIDQIYIDSDNKISFIPRIGTHVVQIGNFDNIETKLSNLEMYYDQIMPKVGWDRYNEIDLRFDGQVVCR